MHLSRHFDQVAIALSAICIVHCLALPIVVVALPVAALSLGDNQHFHGVMLWVVVPTSLVGLLLGYRLHQRVGFVALGALGIVVLAAAATYGHAGWSLALEVAVSVAGSLMLGTAHWLNFGEVRRCHRHRRFDPSRASASD
jgi:MerC mercury resistance protein